MLILKWIYAYLEMLFLKRRIAYLEMLITKCFSRISYPDLLITRCLCLSRDGELLMLIRNAYLDYKTPAPCPL